MKNVVPWGEKTLHYGEKDAAVKGGAIGDDLFWGLRRARFTVQTVVSDYRFRVSFPG